MRVKLLVVGIIYFICILIKTGASNKCYRAKICIHDGRVKCGQDLEGKIRRFLDSCDMKEYNCLKHANYVKTNHAKCQNLPVIEEKPIAKETATDRNESHKKIKIKGDDTGRTSDESNDSEVKRADSNLETSQENENGASSKTGDANRISEGVEKVNEKDKVLEVDVVLVSEENKNSTENKEDRPTGKVEANRDTEQEGEGKSEEDNDNNVSEENEKDGVDRVNNSNEPREDDDNGRINGISVTDSTSKVENENKNDADQDNNSYRKDDEEKVDKLLVENVYDTDETY